MSNAADWSQTPGCAETTPDVMAGVAGVLNVYTASGTDTYTVTMDPALEAYSTKVSLLVKFTNTNTGAATLNVNALGAKSLVKGASTALAAGDIIAGKVYRASYDGTNFQLAEIPSSPFSSGTYTPTLTNVANLDSSTAFQCQYLRVGSVVTVSGVVSVDPTTGGGTLTRLGITLPIASNLSGSLNLGGTAASDSVASESAAIEGDSTNDRAEMRWRTNTTSSNNMWFSFTYLVL